MPAGAPACHHQGFPAPALAEKGPRKKVAIIGAGPGGLAAALILASRGVQVALFEKAETVGGRTRTFTSPEGFRFDFGPTFFLYPQVLAQIFESCGERLEDHVRLRKLDPQYRLIFEGSGTLDASADLDRLEAEVARLAPRDARSVRPFLDENRRKLESFGPVLSRPFSRAADLLSPALLGSIRHLRPHRSVDQDLARHFADPRVRLAFSFQTKYLGMSPFRCPSLFTILSFLEYEYGVFHPVGGCGAVSEAMANLAERMGVEIRLRTPVERIVFDGGAARGVEAGGNRFSADAVVINGDFGHVVRALVPERFRRAWPDRKIERARLSCSAFMLYLGIDGGLEPLAHHSILLAREYERNIREIETGRLPQEPSIYVQNAGVTDPGMAPPGHASLYVLVPVPNLRCGIDWQREAPGYRSLVLSRLAALGIPDIERRIRFERMVTPADWRDDFAVNEGATFNLTHDFGQMLYFRPRNRFGAGLYLVGGGTHPGSGLPVIYEGARITSSLLLSDLGLAPSAAAAWAQARAPFRGPQEMPA